jgi:KUP system potassium uptake protein
VMTTRIKGRVLLSEYMDERRVLFEDLEEKIKGNW